AATYGSAAARDQAGARRRVGPGTGTRRRRVAAPGDPPPRACADGAHPPPARRAARPRARTRAAARLRRPRAPVRDRDPAVLPPGGVVGIAARGRRARALLRRPSGRRV